MEDNWWYGSHKIIIGQNGLSDFCNTASGLTPLSDICKIESEQTCSDSIGGRHIGFYGIEDYNFSLVFKQMASLSSIPGILSAPA
jgi:hypothetical protein